MENNELMGILEQLERDKGINKEILIEAVEAAVASAAKKIWTVDKEEDVKVVLNPKTGKLQAYAGDQEIRSSEFGRIAAQTAKQVVIQKIREAEKDVVYNDYQTRVGEIISGAVYRFDKGNIIVDLGKTEALIPKREQSPKEEFRQGDRIRAYVMDVRKETKGPQIVLSRGTANFVRRLFELEVPEIFEGIVEVKSIARDVGERTKIAVYSKDEKVDCVGACVGMRGARVKNIVSELQGEKIDIVRYASDIKEYIQAALSPAEISQIQLNADDKKANIIVADDQLSLAIGKHGQNVRLASQLVGWELDIYSFEQWKELEEDDGEDSEKEVTEEVEEISVESLQGVGGKLLKELEDKGFGSLKELAEAQIEDLVEIKGLGKVKAQKLIDEAKELLEQVEQEEQEEAEEASEEDESEEQEESDATNEEEQQEEK